MNPFITEIAQTLERISYVLFGTWVISKLDFAYTSWIMKETEQFMGKANTIDEFLFMAGLAYIISQVFKRGVEIQSENELTV